MLTNQELGSMTLQRLAYILPQTMEEETMVKEVFEARAKHSTYQTLTTIDVKLGWQEEIIQKYVDLKRETMAPENPAFLTPEEEANLDTAVITKGKELELQAKLDKRNHKKVLKEGTITDTEFADTKLEITSEVTGTPLPEPVKATASKIKKPVMVVKKKK
jgi:hypothetical protein